MKSMRVMAIGLVAAGALACGATGGGKAAGHDNPSFGGRGASNWYQSGKDSCHRRNRLFQLPRFVCFLG